MDKQRWLGELEVRCRLLAKKNKGVNRNSIEDRDRLIQFANRLVDKQLVSRPQMLTLIENMDQQIFGSAEVA